MGKSQDSFGGEHRGVALIGELLLQLGQRESFRRKLTELEERIGPSAVSKILDELEKAMDRLGREPVQSSAPPASEKPPEADQRKPWPETGKKETPKREDVPPISAPDVPRTVVPREDLPKPPGDPFADLLANLNLAAAEIPTIRPKQESQRSTTTQREVNQEKPPVSAPPTPAGQTIPPKVPDGRPKESLPPSAPLSKPTPPDSAKDESRPAKPIVPSTPKPEAPLARSEPDRAKEDAKRPLEKTAGAAQPVQQKPPTEQVPPLRREEPVTEKKPGPPKPPAGVEKPGPETALKKKDRVSPELPPAEPSRETKKAVDSSVYMPRQVQLRKAFPLEEQDILYLHGVAQIPVDEKPAAEPFVLEERGIESKESVFVIDRGGMRFYLSRISGRSMNVSKTGVLLLNKQESIHLRGTHFGILNDLRTYGILLPFEFGVVAQGVEDLYGKIDEHIYEIRDALEELLATKWWELTVYAYDSKMAPMVAPEAPQSTRRERDRRGAVDRTAGSASRIDIKTLERVLNKQKSIAEEIHKMLEVLAVRSDVDMMVGLNSGSSEDWKPILRASYELTFPEIYRFTHAITDLQYHHVKYQLMFVLKGDSEDYTFQQG